MRIAAVRWRADPRAELAQLRITRPVIANERLKRNRAGQVVLQLKSRYKDGTTHIVMEPLEFMERLAALVPRPRLHLIRFHGVLAPNAKFRTKIVPPPARARYRDLKRGRPRAERAAADPTIQDANKAATPTQLSCAKACHRCTLTDTLSTITVGIVAEETTIDGAGRIVIPKSLRDRMNLTPDARLHIFEEAGCLIISPDRPEPRLVERDGFLALDLGIEASVNTDSGAARQERIRQLVEYVLRR